MNGWNGEERRKISSGCEARIYIIEQEIQQLRKELLDSTQSSNKNREDISKVASSLTVIERGFWLAGMALVGFGKEFINWLRS